jgi:hypothetical protein
MRKLLFVCFIFAVLGMSTWVNADSFTYDLVYKIDGAKSFSEFTYIGQLGTITISDDLTNTRAVNVKVELNSGLKLLEFDLNYGDSNTILPLFSINLESLSVDRNNKPADGYSGKFDVAIPGNGNLGNVDTFSCILTAGNNFDLNASGFNMLDTLNLLHVAAHIGKGTVALPGGVASLWAGDGNAGTRVSEPNVLLFMGAGLLGLSGLSRHIKKS